MGEGERCASGRCAAPEATLDKARLTSGSRRARASIELLRELLGFAQVTLGKNNLS